MDNKWESDQMLHAYLLDYLRKQGYNSTAEAFVQEARVPTEPVLINAPGGFVFEWWSIFWDIFTSRPKQKERVLNGEEVKKQFKSNGTVMTPKSTSAKESPIPENYLVGQGMRKAGQIVENRVNPQTYGNVPGGMKMPNKMPRRPPNPSGVVNPTDSPPLNVSTDQIPKRGPNENLSTHNPGIQRGASGTPGNWQPQMGSVPYQKRKSYNEFPQQPMPNNQYSVEQQQPYRQRFPGAEANDYKEQQEKINPQSQDTNEAAYNHPSAKQNFDNLPQHMYYVDNNPDPNAMSKKRTRNQTGWNNNEQKPRRRAISIQNISYLDMPTMHPKEECYPMTTPQPLTRHKYSAVSVSGEYISHPAPNLQDSSEQINVNPQQMVTQQQKYAMMAARDNQRNINPNHVMYKSSPAMIHSAEINGGMYNQNEQNYQQNVQNSNMYYN